MHLEGRKAALGSLYSFISFSVHLKKIATAAALEVIQLFRTGGGIIVYGGRRHSFTVEIAGPQLSSGFTHSITHNISPCLHLPCALTTSC